MPARNVRAPDTDCLSRVVYPTIKPTKADLPASHALQMDDSIFRSTDVYIYVGLSRDRDQSSLLIRRKSPGLLPLSGEVL